jgi:2,4-dienoyl-CoA reductase-like NADH-dependent reductase (Old Yellow Enzyme family)
MSKLFESTSLNNMVLANRTIRSATWEGLAKEDGSSTSKLIDLLADLARGGIGLIITSHAYVSPEGQAGPWQLGIYSDQFIPGLVEMTSSIQTMGGKIALQLAHAGSHASSRLSGLEPIGPSAIEKESRPIGREMTRDEIETVTEAFASAAARARRAGFDAIQIHAAHGYLLSQFLSPYFNKRKDEYGGGMENRARLALQVLKAIRKAVGSDFPVFIKLNSEDFLPGGLTVEEMLETAVMLEESGIDAIEMSGGTILSGNRNPSRRGKPGSGDTEAYYEAAARRFKDKLHVPLMLVGGIRTFETAERLITEGVTDYIALCRPLIREPNLVGRWKSGDRRPASCLSDSSCFKPALEGQGVSCVVEARDRGLKGSLTKDFAQ